MFHYTWLRQNAGILLLMIIALFYGVPFGALGDEQYSSCTDPADRPPQFTPATHPVEGTELAITEGQLSFTGISTTQASEDASIAMDESGRMLVAWAGNAFGAFPCTGRAIYAVRLNNDGTSACAPVFLTAPIGTDSGIHTFAYEPSAALTATGSALVAWTGNTWGGLGTFPEARSRAFDLDDLCSLAAPTPPSGPSGGDNDQEVSAAIGGSSSVLTWSRDHNSAPDPWGLLYAVTSEQQIRGCELGCDPSDCVGEDI